VNTKKVSSPDIYISAVQALFCIKFTELLNNKVYTFVANWSLQ